MSEDKFLSKLYDILIESNIINFYDNPDLKTRKERLNKYLDKLSIVQSKAFDKEEYIHRLKELYYDRYIIKEENIPDSYFESLSKQYRDLGYGKPNLVNPTSYKDKELRKEHINTIIREQKDSLDVWLDYFLSKDSDYLPMWAKVWAFQGMLSIGNLNKDKDGYGRRNNSNVNPFVSFDAELLGKCVDFVMQAFNKEEITDKEVEKLVSSGSFPKLYGTLLANKKEIRIVSNDGKWVKYNYETTKEAERKLKEGKEPEYLRLYNDLQGYNTGWCTAASRETAKSQICGGKSYEGGDFYVYYTKNENNEYKIPRIAIRMNKNSIGEIRGIAQSQNIENSMEVVLEEKLREFPDASLYRKKVSDMKKLTEIYNTYKGRELTTEELRFLYEIDGNMIGFGYQKDPRIKEVLKKRKIKKDLASIFNCKENEIGTSEKDLNRNLVCYLGNIDYKKMKENGNYTLPSRYVDGDLDLSCLSSVEGITLPQVVKGILDISNLITLKGLILPQSVQYIKYKSTKEYAGNKCSLIDFKKYLEQEERDMEKLTEIYNNYGARELAIEELIFIYELDYITVDRIGIGQYTNDYRTKELRKNIEEDFLKLFPMEYDTIGERKSPSYYEKRFMKIYFACGERELTIEELRVLYEIDEGIHSFTGFLYPKIIRIQKILGERNIKKDLARVFDCREDEIGTNAEDLNKSLTCYVGDIYMGFPGQLDSANSIKLPSKYLRGNLWIGNVKFDKLEMPQSVRGRVFLRDNRIKYIKLPQIIITEDSSLDALEIARLGTSKEMELPKKINNGNENINVCLEETGNYYSLKQLKKMQKQLPRQKELYSFAFYENIDKQANKSSKNRGFISISFIIISILLIFIFSIFIGIFIINK